MFMDKAAKRQGIIEESNRHQPIASQRPKQAAFACRLKPAAQEAPGLAPTVFSARLATT
jgi:hypothetical protein